MQKDPVTIEATGFLSNPGDRCVSVSQVMKAEMKNVCICGLVFERRYIHQFLVGFR